MARDAETRRGGAVRVELRLLAAALALTVGAVGLGAEHHRGAFGRTAEAREPCSWAVT